MDTFDEAQVVYDDYRPPKRWPQNEKFDFCFDLVCVCLQQGWPGSFGQSAPAESHIGPSLPFGSGHGQPRPPGNVWRCQVCLHGWYRETNAIVCEIRSRGAVHRGATSWSGPSFESIFTLQGGTSAVHLGESHSRTGHSVRFPPTENLFFFSTEWAVAPSRFYFTRSSNWCTMPSVAMWPFSVWEPVEALECHPEPSSSRIEASTNFFGPTMNWQVPPSSPPAFNLWPRVEYNEQDCSKTNQLWPEFDWRIETSGTINGDRLRDCGGRNNVR